MSLQPTFYVISEYTYLNFTSKSRDIINKCIIIEQANIKEKDAPVRYLLAGLTVIISAFFFTIITF